MFRFVLLLLVLVALMTAQVAMAQDEGKMMDESMMDEAMKEEMMAGEFSAVVNSLGRVRIRAGASLDTEIVGFCPARAKLTVWLPAAGDWLAASCHDVNGFIHSSLVDVGDAVVPADDAMMDEGKMADEMMDDGKMADEKMDDAMKEEMMAGEFSAVVNSLGRVRIRAGASLDTEIVGFCPAGAKLTVWLPAAGDWLAASCHDVNGFIHSSLVDVGDLVIPTISDLGGSDEMAMKDDMSMDEM